MTDIKYYNQCSQNAASRYKSVYNVDVILNKFISLYKGVVNE